MDIKRKIEIAKAAVRSLTTHDDMDAAVRLAALDELGRYIEAERAAIGARVQAKIDATVGAAPAPAPEVAAA